MQSQARLKRKKEPFRMEINIKERWLLTGEGMECWRRELKNEHLKAQCCIMEQINIKR